MTMVGFVTVRTMSTRLPGKALLPLGNSPSVLEHVVRRAQHFDIEPVICTSDCASDDSIARVAEALSVPVFRGPAKNKVLRWKLAAEKFKVPIFHTLDNDDPYFDETYVKRSLGILDSRHNMMVICPSPMSSAGAALSGYSVRTVGLRQALKGLPTDAETEMFDSLIMNLCPDSVTVLDDDSRVLGRELARLTLDYEDDYRLLQNVADQFDFSAPRSQIDDFLDISSFKHLNSHCSDSWRDRQEHQRRQTKSQFETKE